MDHSNHHQDLRKNVKRNTEGDTFKYMYTWVDNLGDESGLTKCWHLHHYFMGLSVYDLIWFDLILNLPTIPVGFNIGCSNQWATYCVNKSVWFLPSSCMNSIFNYCNGIRISKHPEPRIYFLILKASLA